MADPQGAIPLYEPEGFLLQVSPEGKGYYDAADHAAKDAGGVPSASLSGRSKVGMGGSQPAERAVSKTLTATGKPARAERALSPEELMALANQMSAQAEQYHANSLAQGPAVKRLAGGSPGSNFNTELTSGAEAAFPEWLQSVAPGDSGADYDYRGAFAAGEGRGKDAHMTDRFKKPNHPTFSDESDYSDQGAPGTWDKNDEYVPYWKR